MVSSGSGNNCYSLATFTSGKTYKLTGKVAVVSGSYNVRVETDQPSWLNLFTTSSTDFVNFEAYFVCVNTSIDLRFTIYNATTTSSDKIKIEKDIERDFKDALVGIKMLPVNSRAGVYLSYLYYYHLFKKIKYLSPSRLLAERIRIPNIAKLALMFKAIFKNQLNSI